MKKILQNAFSLMDANEEQIRENIHQAESSVSFYKRSIHKADGAIVSMGRDHSSRFLMVISARESGLIAEFSGEQIGDSGIFARKCPLNHHNARVLRKYFPWTAPVPVASRPATVGFGDRIGLATLGHVAAVNHYNMAPVLAQQSVWELHMTGRTYFDVIDDATFQVFEAGYKDGYGADADHLKSIGDIDTALTAGMTMFTIDVSAKINEQLMTCADARLDELFTSLPEEARERVESCYSGREFEAGGKVFSFDERTAKLCAVLYNEAIEFAAESYRYICEAKGDDLFDMEVCLDATASPTPPEHHYYIAMELHERQVAFSAIAPCFIDHFELVVEYPGETEDFAGAFAVHKAVADKFGHKLSIHSGSDKVKLFPVIAGLSEGRFHIKISGTSWLMAVKLIAVKDPVLFKIMYNCAKAGLEKLKGFYKVSVKADAIPPVDDMYEDQLVSLLELPAVRQMLHVGFGAILKDKTINPLLVAALHKYEKPYVESLKSLYDSQLELLGVEQR